MPLTLTVEDRLDIDQTIARYAHVLNNTDFDALDLVFTHDAVLSTAGVAEPRRGIAEIREALSAQPIADRMTTNVCIDVGDNGVRVWSMFLVVTDEGRAINGDYLDVVVRTEAGWRVAERTVVRGYSGADADANAAAYKSWLFSRRRSTHGTA